MTPGVSTVVLVPCFSGSAWDVEQLAPLRHLTLVAPGLPERLDDIEEYVDFLAGVVADLRDYAVVGDSFGAAVALGLAVRQPEGLRALVLSGGFASDPVRHPLVRLGSRLVSLQRGLVYDAITLRVHARLLASRHDSSSSAERPWSRRDTRALFSRATPAASYVARLKAARGVDLAGRLDRVTVPTLVLSPSEDTLVDRSLTAALVEGLPDAEEIVLPGTGHMFRFAHPARYAGTVADFLTRRGLARTVA